MRTCIIFSTYTTSLAPIIQAHGFSYHFYADDTELYLSFDDPTVAARISGCLADISAWMKEYHLQLNLAKTELPCLPCHSNSTAWLHDSVRFINNYPISFGQKSWCNLWCPSKNTLQRLLDLAGLHYTTVKKIRPFLTEYAAQLLVQALVISRLVYCNALLAGFPSNTIKPLNDSECIGTTGLQLAQKSPYYTSHFLLALATSCSLHPVQDTDACI